MSFFPSGQEAKHHRLFPRSAALCGTGTAQRREPETRPTSWILAWTRTSCVSPIPSSGIDLLSPRLRRRPHRMFQPCRLSQRAPPIRPAEKFSSPLFVEHGKAGSLACVYPLPVYHVHRGLGLAGCMLGRAACLICFGHFPMGRDALGANRPEGCALRTGWGRAGD